MRDRRRRKGKIIGGPAPPGLDSRAHRRQGHFVVRPRMADKTSWTKPPSLHAMGRAGARRGGGAPPPNYLRPLAHDLAPAWRLRVHRPYCANGPRLMRPGDWANGAWANVLIPDRRSGGPASLRAVTTRSCQGARARGDATVPNDVARGARAWPVERDRPSSRAEAGRRRARTPSLI